MQKKNKLENLKSQKFSKEKLSNFIGSGVGFCTVAFASWDANSGFTDWAPQEDYSTP